MNKKWYIFYISGEGDHYFMLDLSEEEMATINRLMVAQGNIKRTSYGGTLYLEAGAFETEADAKKYIAKFLPWIVLDD